MLGVLPALADAVVAAQLLAILAEQPRTDIFVVSAQLLVVCGAVLVAAGTVFDLLGFVGPERFERVDGVAAALAYVLAAVKAKDNCTVHLLHAVVTGVCHFLFICFSLSNSVERTMSVWFFSMIGCSFFSFSF